MKRSTRRTPTIILRRTMTGEPSDISGSGRVLSDIGDDPELLTHFPQLTQMFSHLISAVRCYDEANYYPFPGIINSGKAPVQGITLFAGMHLIIVVSVRSWIAAESSSREREFILAVCLLH
jgi:hypothetical protein